MGQLEMDQHVNIQMLCEWEKRKKKMTEKTIAKFFKFHEYHQSTDPRNSTNVKHKNCEKKMLRPTHIKIILLKSANYKKIL